MKILYLAPEMVLPGTHGGSSHVIEAVESLTRLGNKIIIICKMGEKQKFHEINNIEYIRIPSIPTSIGKNISYFLSTFLITAYLILIKKTDLIYERGRIFGGPGVLVAKLLGKKSIYEMIEPFAEVPALTGQIKEGSLLHKIIKKWHYFTVNKATLVTITHNSFLKGINTNYVYVDTGVDPTKFHPDIDCKEIKMKYHLKDGKTIVYNGSFNEWHSCKNIIEAAKILIKKDNEIKLLMIGDGQRYKNCNKLVEGYNLKNNIILTGKIKFNEVPKYINASDICLALFDREYPPFKKFSYYYSPIKTNEYKACGKAIIASDFGNLKILIKPKINGLLVNEHNINEIANAIELLVNNNKLRYKIGKNNRKEVLEEFNWDIINSKLLRVLENIRKIN